MGFYRKENMCTAHTLLVIGALLGTQNGREVEIVNTFELAMEKDKVNLDHGIFTARREQCECLPSHPSVL